ncbi:MAG: hypothetical protein WBY44_01475 [Bryobacteraceae bacterium]|jgi:hypothetical protein
MKHPEPDDMLSAAARTVGRAAGKAAMALGFEDAEASKPIDAPEKSGPNAKGGKRLSARFNRIARAAVAKKAAIASGKQFAAGDLRYKRIVGKTPAAWSDADVDYVERLTSAKKQGAPA